MHGFRRLRRLRGLRHGRRGRARARRDHTTWRRTDAGPGRVRARRFETARRGKSHSTLLRHRRPVQRTSRAAAGELAMVFFEEVDEAGPFFTTRPRKVRRRDQRRALPRMLDRVCECSMRPTPRGCGDCAGARDVPAVGRVGGGGRRGFIVVQGLVRRAARHRRRPRLALCRRRRRRRRRARPRRGGPEHGGDFSWRVRGDFCGGGGIAREVGLLPSDAQLCTRAIRRFRFRGRAAGSAADDCKAGGEATCRWRQLYLCGTVQDKS
mmetsp:Transcript_3861/g.11847  ORF Transcript_3861/g.11847 Transcript_3861/m.11847 type:complete len:266 (-) Transcript_3861:684-1481(-)